MDTPDFTTTTAMLVNNSKSSGSEFDFYSRHTSIDDFDKIITPVWYIIGFPGNLIAFVVWIQPRMRPSSGCYLAALAMADFVFLILHIFFELQWIWNINIFAHPGLCSIYPIVFYISQYLSPMLVLGFTVERYIAVCHPFQSARYCTTRRAVTTIICLVAFCFSLHAVQGYFWYYDPEMKECNVRASVVVNDERSVWAIWGWVTELLVFGLAPLTILVLNIFVLAEARRMSNNQARLMQSGHRSAAATVTLLAVSFYLIFTTLPVTVFYCMQRSFQQGNYTLSDESMDSDPTWSRYFTFYTVRKIVEEICLSHYACNFIIYLTTGKLFRRELKILCFSMFCKSKLTDMRRKEFIANTKTELLLRNGSSNCERNGSSTSQL